MVLKCLKKADDYTFNKANIMPILSATIGSLITVVTVTAMCTPTLFGSLSEGSLESLGLTPAVLGLTAVTSKFTAIAAVQQIFTNRAIENVSRSEPKGIVLKYTGEVNPGSALHDVSVINDQNVTAMNGNSYVSS